jgi:hypothetical protein
MKVHAARRSQTSHFLLCVYVCATTVLIILWRYLRTALLGSLLAGRSLQNTLFQHTFLTRNFRTRYEERSFALHRCLQGTLSLLCHPITTRAALPQTPLPIPPALPASLSRRTGRSQPQSYP